MAIVGGNHSVIVAICSDGILLAIAEAHTVIRFFFQILNLKPREQRDPEKTNKQSNDIDHAGYFLIVTLISITFAGIPALIIRYLFYVFR